MFLLKILCLCVVVTLPGCKSSPEPTAPDSSTPAITQQSQVLPSPPNHQTLPTAVGGRSPSAISPVLPTYDETTRDISTSVGARFTLVLTANITTPYRWIIDETVESRVFELVKDEYLATPRSNCPSCVGSGGKRHLTFTTTKPGAHLLSLRYQSITDPNEAPASTYQVTVHVK